MAKKKVPANSAAKPLRGSGVAIDHACIVEEDLPWLLPIKRLSLWDVDVPHGFLAKLPNLWWLDIRGGSAKDIMVADGADKLECLIVNQIRGLEDLSLLTSFRQLRFLSVYGLPKLVSFPDLSPLTQLEHADIGQLKGLRSLIGILSAPNLKELYMVRRVNISEEDLDCMSAHQSLEKFY